MEQLQQYWRGRWQQLMRHLLNLHAGSDPQLARLVPLAVLGSLAMPLYYWIWHGCFEQPYESPLLRIIGVLICLPAPLALRLPPPWRRRYIMLGLTYMLPFFFTYMFLMNRGSLVWTESLLVALIVLFHFDTRTALAAYLVGSVLACLAYTHSGDPGTLLTAQVLQQLPIHWFAIVALSLAKIGRDVLAREKLAGMGAGLASVAHELRTPLLTLDANARGLSRILPAAGAAAHWRQASPAERTAAQQALQRMQFEVRHMHHLIDLFLLSATAVNRNLGANETLGMAALVDAALRRYPYDDPAEQQVVRCEVRQDFRFAGQSELAVVIVLNLLRNALQAIRRAGKGRVRIVVDGAHRPPRLLFIDTGGGIAAQRLPRIFERFYSYPAHTGSGIGLALCRDILLEWKAGIRCRSREHAYAVFVLDFPLQPMLAASAAAAPAAPAAAPLAAPATVPVAVAEAASGSVVESVAAPMAVANAVVAPHCVPA